MTKYRIYTTNDTKPFIIETNGDLLNDYIHAMEFNHPTMSIWHKKDMQALGVYKYRVVLNTHQIVSITTVEKA